jgi:molybdate transport system regulatory protein
MGMKINERAIAIIKASSITLSTDKDDYKNYENIFEGKVSHIVKGITKTEVTVELPSKATLTATLENDVYERFNFSVGQKVYAGFKASDVILGV